MEVAVKRSPIFIAPRAWSSAMRALTPVPVGERSILPGRIATAERADKPSGPRSSGPANRQKGDMPPVRQRRVREAELRIFSLDDRHALFRQVARLGGFEREAEGCGIDDDEAVAAIGGVDGQRPAAVEFEPGIQDPCEGRDVAQQNSLRLAVAAFGAHRDEAARRFQDQFGDRLLHRQDAAVEQNGRDADRVRAGHRRRILRLHDDEAHLRVRVLRRDQQVDMPEYPAARLVQEEIPQRAVFGDPAPLVPQGFARRRFAMPPTMTSPTSPSAWQEMT